MSEAASTDINWYDPLSNADKDKWPFIMYDEFKPNELEIMKQLLIKAIERLDRDKQAKLIEQLSSSDQ
jgi:hypothetical protein